jgi:hypothetical protein
MDYCNVTRRRNREFEDNAIVRYDGKQTVEVTEDCERQLKKHELLKTLRLEKVEGIVDVEERGKSEKGVNGKI